MSLPQVEKKLIDSGLSSKRKDLKKREGRLVGLVGVWDNSNGILKPYLIRLLEWKNVNMWYSMIQWVRLKNIFYYAGLAKAHPLVNQRHWGEKCFIQSHPKKCKKGARNVPKRQKAV